MNFNYSKICAKTLENVSPKEKEVLVRRFGLAKNETETLQKIGENFGITRERVRQIERDGFVKVAKESKKDYLQNVFSCFENYLKSFGGAKREDLLLKELGKENFQNQIYFLLNLGDSFSRFSETEEFYPFWASEKGVFQKIGQIVKNVLVFLEKQSVPVEEEKIFNLKKQETPQIFQSSLEIAKRIERGPLGKFGLVDWSEIKPKGVKDKAYLALKKQGKPLHFTNIAKIASAIKADFFKEKQVLPQTVHNELIKDPRFVLVGRGIYALKEWGYEGGTVKEIIKNILKESKKPMLKEDVLREVQKQRLVKENTIILNLADKNYFLRDEEGHYTIRNI